MPPKVLVANRGEIAIRILRAASELGWLTVALYTDNDISHATYADEAIKLPSVAHYLDVKTIVDIAYSTRCTHLHPGYGFLSESPVLPIALQASPSITFIGPSPSTLRIASDKMLSRDLALSLGVPVAPGKRVSSAEDVKAFALSIDSHVNGGASGRVGYPLMIKALDGGGGRGIRVVHHESEVDEAFQRCLGESPSKQLFVEKALTGPGWKHVEVQVIGDGVSVNHFWERECSVQRRFQKLVEIAPSSLPRTAVQPLIDDSLTMARRLEYKGLGTFEFLINAHEANWVFLEINPRVQVEHTITEEINNIDLVRAQLLLFSPSPPPSPSPSSSSTTPTLASLSLSNPPPIPSSHAIQLRVTAEDPLARQRFSLSPGTIRASDVSWPAGRGVRVDTWLSYGPNEVEVDQEDGEREGDELKHWRIGTEFDSLLAKIIVHGSSFEETTRRGVRALSELRISSRSGDAAAGAGAGVVRTNVAVLLGTLLHPHWVGGGGGGGAEGKGMPQIDTLWLERNLDDIIQLGAQAQAQTQKGKGLGMQKSRKGSHPSGSNAKSTGNGTGTGTSGGGGGGVLLQPGSLFHLTLQAPSDSDSEHGSHSNTNSHSNAKSIKHTITLTSIGQNAFPSSLSGTFLSSFPSPFSSLLPSSASSSPSPSSSSTSRPTPHPIAFTLTQSTSASATDQLEFEIADPNDPTHVSAPMTGKIVELHRALVEARNASINTNTNSNPNPNTTPKLKVKKGDPLLILSVMKMENVISAPCDGYITRVGRGVRVGGVIGEGRLVCVCVCVFEGGEGGKARL